VAEARAEMRKVLLKQAASLWPDQNRLAACFTVDAERHDYPNRRRLGTRDLRGTLRCRYDSKDDVAPPPLKKAILEPGKRVNVRL
jgi:hypothetical protein